MLYRQVICRRSVPEAAIAASSLAGAIGPWMLLADGDGGLGVAQGLGLKLAGCVRAELVEEPDARSLADRVAPRVPDRTDGARPVREHGGQRDGVLADGLGDLGGEARQRGEVASPLGVGGQDREPQDGQGRVSAVEPGVLDERPGAGVAGDVPVEPQVQAGRAGQGNDVDGYPGGGVPGAAFAAGFAGQGEVPGDEVAVGVHPERDWQVAVDHERRGGDPCGEVPPGGIVDPPGRAHGARARGSR